MKQVTNCPYRQASLLQHALTPDKMRVAFFLGAGCPSAIKIADGTNSKPLIPHIEALTKAIYTTLSALPEYSNDLQVLQKRLVDKKISDPNIEKLLSHIRSLQDVLGDKPLDGLTAESLIKIDKKICESITEIVNVDLPNPTSPYHKLANWVRGIQRPFPVELFTTNYDLLLEQALEQQHVPYFDGFIGSYRAFFDQMSIEHDILPPRWARLWKIHGSINWWKTLSDEVERRPSGKPEDQQLIHPSHLKYDQSRKMPYLAMMDRLRSFLSRGQAVLVTCGYSFADLHLNDIILQGLNGNPNAICFGLLFGDISLYPEAVKQALRQPSFSLLAVDSCICNGVQKDWHCEQNAEHILHGAAVSATVVGGRTKASGDRCKFLLGDFEALGSFLSEHLANGQTDAGAIQ